MSFNWVKDSSPMVCSASKQLCEIYFEIFKLVYTNINITRPSGHNGYGTRLHIRGVQVRVLSQNIYFLIKLNHLM